MIVSSGYKWLRGTYGAAVAYISPELSSSLTPGLIGFRSHADIWDLKADRMQLPNDASRFEYTTIHFGAVLGLAASVNEINEFGIDNVWRYDISLADSLIQGVRELGIEIASPLSESERSAIISLRLPDEFDSIEVANRLQNDFSILVTSRAGLLRVSPHFDNTNEDIQKLLDALRIILL